MKFQELKPGRYKCRMTDWALSEVEKVNNALAVTIRLSIRVPDQSDEVVGWWSGFVKTKDGRMNEKTLKTLLSGGFNSTDIYSLNNDPSALDTTKEMEVTLVTGDDGKIKAEWLNSGGPQLKKTALKKKDLMIEGALASALKGKQEKKKAASTDDDELPF